jgi:acylphosphatase
MEPARAHLLISGRVQGVCFRAYAEEEAQSLGLKGWVKNLLDGRVEVVCEGEKDDVERFVEWCHQGPPGALVRDIDVGWETVTDEFDAFTIEYGH